MRPATKSDGSEYYEFVLLYTDNVLCISENSEKTIREEIEKYFDLKKESVRPPKIYFDSQLRQVVLDNGIKT